LVVEVKGPSSAPYVAGVVSLAKGSFEETVREILVWDKAMNVRVVEGQESFCVKCAAELGSYCPMRTE